MAASGLGLLAVLVAVLLGGCGVEGARAPVEQWLRMPREGYRPGEELGADGVPEGGRAGTRWAVLIAGSSGYGNYRHQADVCHAYQILKNNGLKDENIVLFMYDDIAFSPDNPHKGTIINSPRGVDVYAGVPKDYTGAAVTVNNFFAVLLGDKSAVQGGSGKVVASAPEDHIFIYYTDHGGPGVLGMPNVPNLFANDFLETLKLKHALGTYAEMVIYLEACESGSIFEGLLPEGLNVYVTTASNAQESSWGTYCPGMENPPPPEYWTCLGDLYSVAWMEDCEVENLEKETLKDQYLIVKKRTSNDNTYRSGSHVMQYGDIKINSDRLSLFLGYDPLNANVSRPDLSDMGIFGNSLPAGESLAVNQRDADLLHYWHKYKHSPEGSRKKIEAAQDMARIMSQRAHIDSSVNLLGKLLFGSEWGPEVLGAVRKPGLPLVDDWQCLKAVVRAYESKCGSLTQYGMKHMRSFANMCNSGFGPEKVAEAAAEACSIDMIGVARDWAPLATGFSA